MNNLSGLKMLYLLWIFSYFKLISGNFYVTPKNPMLEYLLKDKDLITAQNLVNTTEDILADSYQRINSLYIIKQDSMKFAAFEIGYLICIIQTKYKKMVDKYETANKILTYLYKPEILILLEEVESIFWEIQHIASMLHEIERKYKLYGSLTEDYSETLNRKKEGKLAEWLEANKPALDYTPITTKKPKERLSILQYIDKKLQNRGKTKPRKRPWRFPIDYGWYVEPEWNNEG